MPKNLPVKTEVSRQRKLTGINVTISPYTRDVVGTFRFSNVATFADGTKETAPGVAVHADETDLAPFLTDAMWDAVSTLAHGLADKQKR
jgi:hypothetical protein